VSLFEDHLKVLSVAFSRESSQVQTDALTQQQMPQNKGNNQEIYKQRSQKDTKLTPGSGLDII